jgi:predicted RNase H-like nuclease (RuvC/YqgF family)
VPFSDRIDGHYEKVARFGGTYEESDQVKLEVPKVMHRVFNFYGAYVSLNQKERDKNAREQMLTYYRDCVCELEDKNRVLEQSIDILKDLNMKYSNELTSLRDRVAVAESQNHRLVQENRETLKKFEEAERNLKDAAAYERKHLEEELGIEKQMLRDELRVNEALNK